MDKIPAQVTVLIPTSAGNLKGRYSTSFPYGALVSLRLPHISIEAIDQARKLIDANLSRGMFMRMAAVRIAEAIITHNEQYLRTPTDERDIGTPTDV